MSELTSPLSKLVAANDDPSRPILVTGGAGFIGANVANYLLSNGQPVRILDDLSRVGADQNLVWLSEKHSDKLEVEIGDVRDRAAIKRALDGTSGVFHFAAQTAVITSLENPMDDFAVNVLGTLNLLEELRTKSSRGFFVYTSTSKVYGGLTDLAINAHDSRYHPVDRVTSANGIGENRRLDFASPLACSKGAADQYVLDYARSFKIPSVVLRLGCTYGPRQLGTSAQGWVTHFMRSMLASQKVTLCGDGRQVRDLLFIDDLIEAVMLAASSAAKLAGRAFNIGGGVQNAASVLDVLEKLEELHGARPPVEGAEWRPADQRYYVTDIRAFKGATGWTPKVGVDAGLARLYRWMCDSRLGSDRAAERKAAP
jgi:CDP-paratose 2-epimerase